VYAAQARYSLYFTTGSETQNTITEPLSLLTTTRVIAATSYMTASQTDTTGKDNLCIMYTDDNRNGNVVEQDAAQLNACVFQALNGPPPVYNPACILPFQVGSFACDMLAPVALIQFERGSIFCTTVLSTHPNAVDVSQNNYFCWTQNAMVTTPTTVVAYARPDAGSFVLKCIFKDPTTTFGAMMHVENARTRWAHAYRAMNATCF
jgi:hypothetical protein